MRLSAFCLLFSAITTTTLARVDHVDVTSRTSYLGGKSFGLAGEYERIQGRVYFVLDPASAHDRVIVDLDKAPRNARGEVESTTPDPRLPTPVQQARDMHANFSYGNRIRKQGG